MRWILFVAGLWLASSGYAYAWCTEPRLAAVKPDAPGSFERPDIPRCVSSGRECKEDELEEYQEEVRDYSRHLDEYSARAEEFADDVAHYLDEVRKYVRCERSSSQ